MRMAIVAALAGIAAAQAPDAAEIVRRSVAATDENWKVARNYTFLQRTEERDLDFADQVKSKKVKTYDITLLSGSPYLRLVERDDHPLPRSSGNAVLASTKSAAMASAPPCAKWRTASILR
jgi:hypothetical protein